jgi:TIR domain
MRVFLSYRRGDAGGYAGRLTDTLLQRLGAKSVFHDVTAISPGEDYTVAIDRALADCDAALVVIGPGWLTATSPQGSRRLYEPGDYVRLELATILRRGIRAVPVLVGGARLPKAAELPDDLQVLAQRQAVELHDETWRDDVEGLIRSLRGEPAVPGNRRRRRLAAGVALIALLGFGTGAWLLWGPGAGGNTQSPAAIPACVPPANQTWSSIALSNDPTAVDKTDPAGQLIFKVKSASWRAHNGHWEVVLATSMTNTTQGTEYHEVWRYDYLVVAQRPFTPACFSANGDTVDAGLVSDALIGFDVACKPAGYIELVLEEESGRISVTPSSLEAGSC